MAVEVIAVRTVKERKQFIDLEWEINRTTPNWISPLRVARKEILDPKKNPFFEHAEMELFLAKKDGKVVGRVAAIKNDNHNKFHNDKWGFWGFFESINDQDVANALFGSAGDWLKSKGLDLMVGPMNPSTNDECGLLIKGFDTPPYIMMPHNPEYYPNLVEGYGQKKIKDLYAWHLMTDHALKNISEKMRRVSQKVRESQGIKFRAANMKDLQNEVERIKEIYNDAWSKNWGFIPFTDHEIDHMAKELKQIVDPELLLLAEKGDEPIAFSLTLPNINEILQKIPDGKLLPTGIFKLLFGMKKIKTVRVITLGVKRNYQHLGLGSMFYIETIERAKKNNYIGGEMSWILEDNEPMNNAIRSLGSDLYKTYRIYSYPLD